uniref:Uncharacterized protein n=1 Tax=Oryza nivara TaxID=4536 RepID=A0A0E0J7U9_ORYNI
MGIPTGTNNLMGMGMGRHYPCPSRPIAIPRRKQDDPKDSDGSFHSAAANESDESGPVQGKGARSRVPIGPNHQAKLPDCTFGKKDGNVAEDSADSLSCLYLGSDRTENIGNNQAPVHSSVLHPTDSMPTDAMPLLLTPTLGPPIDAPQPEMTAVVHESAGEASTTSFDWLKLTEMGYRAVEVIQTWSSEVKRLKTIFMERKTGTSTMLGEEKDKNERLNIMLALEKDKNEHHKTMLAEERDRNERLKIMLVWEKDKNEHYKIMLAKEKDKAEHHKNMLEEEKDNIKRLKTMLVEEKDKNKHHNIMLEEEKDKNERLKAMLSEEKVKNKHLKTMLAEEKDKNERLQLNKNECLKIMFVEEKDNNECLKTNLAEEKDKNGLLKTRRKTNMSALTPCSWRRKTRTSAFNLVFTKRTPSWEYIVIVVHRLISANLPFGTAVWAATKAWIIPSRVQQSKTEMKEKAIQVLIELGQSILPKNHNDNPSGERKVLIFCVHVNLYDCIFMDEFTSSINNLLKPACYCNQLNTKVAGYKIHRNLASRGTSFLPYVPCLLLQ